MIVSKMSGIKSDYQNSVQTEGLTGLLPAFIKQLAVASDIKLIEQWVSQLPIANAPKTCQVFFEFLRITNGQLLQPDIRLNILGLIKKNLEIVGPALDVRFIESDLPLDSRAEKAARLGLDCARELGEGYRITINETAFLELSRDLQLKVLHRFLRCQSDIGLRYAQLYKEPPVGFWIAIYRVYRIAESMGLHNEHLILDENEQDCQATIAVLFRQILLFFMCLTDRYRQQNHQQIFNLLAKFSSLSRLSESSEMNSRRAVFAFDFEQDVPPRHVRHMNVKSSSAPCYLFTRTMVESMVSSLKTDSTSVNSGSAISAAQNSLLVELVRNLGAPLRRKVPRVSENEERVILVGMQSIAEAIVCLNKEKPVDAGHNVQNVNQGRKTRNTYLYGCGKSSRFEPKISYIKVPEYDLLPIEEGRDRNVLLRGKTTISKRPNSEFWNGIKPVSITAPCEIWKESLPVTKKVVENYHIKQQQKICGTLLNSSISGYALRWNRTAITQIKVGELIGFPIENKRIELGVVRRICSQDGHLVLGIELLSTDVSSSEILVSEGKSQPICSLQFANLPKAGQPGQSILVQRANFSKGDIVNLAVQGVTTQACVRQLIETTASFRRYNILLLDSNYRKAG